MTRAVTVRPAPLYLDTGPDLRERRSGPVLCDGGVDVRLSP